MRMSVTFHGRDHVASILASRGHEVMIAADPLRTFYRGPERGGDDYQELLRLLRHRSFRKVLRKITYMDGPIRPAELESIAGTKVRSYVDFLCTSGAATLIGDEIVVAKGIDNFGPTLEWYLAQTIHWDLQGSANWSVNLKECPHGDFDVLAWLPPLVYVECKTSDPRDISSKEIVKFLERGQWLAPELAVMLVDTEDDLETVELIDRFEGILRDAMIRRRGSNRPLRARRFFAPTEVHPGAYFGHERFYITNSRPTILEALRVCIRHYHAQVRDYARMRCEPLVFTKIQTESSFVEDYP